MRAVLIGAVESSRIAARALAETPGWELAAIVTLPQEAAGRHSDYVDLTLDAKIAHCPLIHASDVNADDIWNSIAALAPDYLFVIGWSQLCGERMLALTPGRVIGYHPAPLPRLRGRGVIPWTILLQEPITASSLFQIDGGADSGPILSQSFFHVAPDETAATLYAKHMAELGKMMPKLLAELASGTVSPQIQDGRYATWAARRRPEDGEIDWRHGVDAIGRLVRACGDPYPGARTILKELPLVIASAEPVNAIAHSAALTGQIVDHSVDGFVVRCGDGGGLLVREWRWAREGRPALHARLGQPSQRRS